MTTSGTNTRDRLALALDVDDLETAARLVNDVQPWFGVAKVGLELFAAAGPDAIARLRESGVSVFADLKLHDIPTTVGRAARVLGRLGAGYVNFHAAGGVDMLRAGIDGLAEGARDAGHDAPIGLGVTVLTSDRDTSAFAARLDAAITAGCDGVVCSWLEIGAVRAARADFVTMVPGVRLADGAHHDQARVGTPEEVAAAGASVLVIGRAVTAAGDPRRVAAEIHAAVERASTG